MLKNLFIRENLKYKRMKRVNRLLLCFCLLSIVFGSLNAFAIPTVINPSFEADPFNTSGVGYSLNIGAGCTNPLTGWTTNCNGTYPWGLQDANAFNGGPTPYGNQWVVVGDFGAGGTYIEQPVSGFTIGQTYTLEFALASEYSPTGVGSLVEVSFPTGSSTPNQIFEAPDVVTTYWDTWGAYSMNFVADSTDVTIRFLGLAGAGYDAGIDNVSIVGGVSIPEPSTLLLLGSGLMGLAGLRKRFKGKN